LAERVAERKHALLGPRLFLVAARAADAGVELELGDGVEQRHRLVRVAALRRILEHDTAACDRVFHRAHDQALAQLRGASIAKRDHFREVVAGVDVQQRKRKAARAKRLFREAQEHQRILAAGEEQGRMGALARDLAQDVDRFRFEPGEVMRIRRRDRLGPAQRNAGQRRVDHGVVTACDCAARRTNATGRRCSPHSLCSGFSHHQRPARTSSPGSTARVHGAQPMLR
jgi:hypothetical protein